MEIKFGDYLNLKNRQRIIYITKSNTYTYYALDNEEDIFCGIGFIKNKDVIFKTMGCINDKEKVKLAKNILNAIKNDKIIRTYPSIKKRLLNNSVRYLNEFTNEKYIVEDYMSDSINRSNIDKKISNFKKKYKKY